MEGGENEGGEEHWLILEREERMADSRRRERVAQLVSKIRSGMLRSTCLKKQLESMRGLSVAEIKFTVLTGPAEIGENAINFEIRQCHV